MLPRMMPAPRCPRRPGAKRSNHMAVSNIEWKDVATVVEPAVAKCLNPGLREVAEEDLTEEAAPSLSSASAPRGPP